MTHLDTSSLAKYNALNDPHLEAYFSNDRIRAHLKNAGLINRRGEVLSEGEYRTRIAQREHRTHVRQMIAESIVNRAVGLERKRLSEMRQQQEFIKKAAMVNNIRECRRRSGLTTEALTDSSEFILYPGHRSQSQIRPMSANFNSDRQHEEQVPPLRIRSAHTINGERNENSDRILGRRQQMTRSSSKRAKSSSTRRQSETKQASDQAESSAQCQITMVYKGPHTKVDYDHLVFDQNDEIMVMQQHCGGENRIVFKKPLRAGDEFQFFSRRHPEFPFGLSMYINGMMDSRISTCCEYKHRRGVKLGGERGHFAIKSVKGSKMCIKCRFEKQARLKKLGKTPKKGDEQHRQTAYSAKPDYQDMQQRDEQVKSSPPMTYGDDFDDSESEKSPITRTSERKISVKDDKSEVDHFERPKSAKPRPKVSKSVVASSDEDKQSQKSTLREKKKLSKSPGISSDDEGRSNKWKARETPKQPLSLASSSDDESRSKNVIKRKVQQQSVKPSDSSDESERPEISKEERHLKESTSSNVSPREMHSTRSPKNHGYLFIYPGNAAENTKAIEDQLRRTKTKLEIRLINEKDQEIGVSQVNLHSLGITKQSQSNIRSDIEYTANPQKIQLKLSKGISETNEDTERNEDSDQIKFYLDRIELVDQQTENKTIFRFHRWIFDSEEVIVEPTPQSTMERSTRHRHDSTSESEHSQSPKAKDAIPKHSKPSISPIPNHDTNNEYIPVSESRRSSQIESKQSKSKDHSDSTPLERKKYTIIINTSSEATGRFKSNANSEIFIYFNEHTNKIPIEEVLDSDDEDVASDSKIKCPQFSSGRPYKFNIEIEHHIHEKPKKLTVVYKNDEESAKQWSLSKITLIDEKDKNQYVFDCDEPLIRSGPDHSARRTFHVQSLANQDEDTPRASNNDENSTRSSESNRMITSQRSVATRMKNNDDGTSSRRESRADSFPSMADDEANYKSIFKKLDPSNALELGSRPSSRTSVRRSSNDTTSRRSVNPNHQQDLPPMIEPLEGLTDTPGSTQRSNDEKNGQSKRQSVSQRTTDNTTKFQQMYQKKSEDSDDY